MFFITYSQQILFIVLAVCVLWLTIVLTMFLRYLILAAKEIHTTTSKIQKQVEEIERWIKKIKRNFGIGLTAISVIKEAAGSAKDFFANWQENHGTKNKTSVFDFENSSSAETKEDDDDSE